MLKWMIHPFYMVVLAVVAVVAVNGGDFFDDTRKARPVEAAYRTEGIRQAPGPSVTTEGVPPRSSSGPAPGDRGQAEEGAVATQESALFEGSPIELWRAARLAAWRGELERSVSLYRELATREPDSVDAPGEMGNVLMRMGDWSAAAEAFSDAALRAHTGGQTEEVWYLHGVVAGLDPERAATLQQRLAAAPTEH